MKTKHLSDILNIKIGGDVMDKKLFVICLSENFNREKFNELLKLVSQEKQHEINKYQNFIDKKCSLYAQIAVKLIVGKELKIDCKNINILEDSLGKPYIENTKNIKFNISHAGNIIVIGFSNKSIGVDIEFECIDSIKIAKRFFTKKEYEFIKKDVNPPTAFLEIWTKKEAYVKCLGTGLKKSLNSFCTMDNNLKDKFITIKVNKYIISFYDGIYNKDLPIVELAEKEIENLSSLDYL